MRALSMSVLLSQGMLLALALVLLPGGSAAAEVPEYELKAAFLVNFVKFVDWPQIAFAGERTPLAICVYGKDPFGRGLDAAVEGQRLGERILHVQRPDGLDDLDACHVLFVGLSERHRLGQVLARVEGRPVLTVADTEGFLNAGGMINLVLELDRVRFLVNPQAAERSGLKISSKLLRLAMETSPK